MSELGSARIGGHEFRWGQKTYVMGIVNLTPDSFAGDGLGYDVEAAVERALEFQEEGADLVDVGGVSTRPAGAVYGGGAAQVPVEDELRRVLPVVERLAGVLKVPISVDTYRAEVARRALAAGAALVNDVWGLTADPGMAKVVAEAGAPVVVMHNQASYEYSDMLSEVIAGLRRSVALAIRAGIPGQHVIVDPGVGFGKTAEQNLELLRRLDEVKAALGKPLLIGTSRKSTIGLVLGQPVDQRLEGTAATVALAIAKGADIVRVHDVKAMVRVARMSDAIVRGWTRTAAS